MNKVFKSIKASAVLLFIAVFILTFTIIPGDGQIFADSAVKVFIDAGHGGRDPGAMRFELKEKDANLDIALRLKNKLEANGFQVIMTRTSDVYYSLDERVEMANRSGADIFLSIHNNAVFSEYAHGTETFWCPNGVSGSSQFASLVQSNILQQIGRTNRGVKTANFRVIKYTTMPAALVECAFVSNPTENSLLKTADFREKCATGLFNAIKTFAQGIETSTGNYSQSSNSDFSGFTTEIDSPTNNATISSNFDIIGWSADLKNDPPIELKKVEFYKGQERETSNRLGTETEFTDSSQGSTGVLSSGWKEDVDINDLDEGENIIYVYSYDKDGNYSVANVKVNVIKDGSVETNLNPTADPGGPYTATTGEELVFDGSGSADSDGEIAEYIWDFGDGETGSGVDPTHVYEEAGEYTATLKVKDNGGAVSSTVQSTVTVEDLPSEEEEPEEEPGEEPEGGEEISGAFEPVTNSTSFIGYIDISVDDLVRIFEERGSAKVERARRLAPLYIQYGELFDIRADIAWAQMIHETGFLEYTGDVSSEQNNFVGIGATGGGVPGNSFETEELGIIAQYAHLAWYYYPDHVNMYCNSTYDPRHFGDAHIRYTGDRSLGFLNGRWAPGSTYTNKIIIYANEIIDGIDVAGDTLPEQTVTADAGDDKTAEVDEEVLFDASASIISPDDEETSVTYSWDWDGDGTYDETVETATITHAFTEAGTYEVVLKVIAFEDIEDTDTVTVTVNEPNQIPTADAGGPYTAEAGQETTLNGSVSSDSDGDITEYVWDFGDGSEGTGVSPVHTYAEAGEYTVALTVKDDDEAVSEESTAIVTIEEAVVEETSEEEETYPVNTSFITNSTSVIGYTSITVEQLVKIFKDRNSSKVEWARRIAPIYIQYGKLFNIRADIAWAQMCHETGFLEYTGDVSPDQKNFVGMGATGGGVPGNSFATEELGIIAHFAHLAWYYYPDHVNMYCNATYDPRHFGSTHYRYTGDTTLGFLNGKWAPGSTYTDKIILFANQIYDF